MIKYDCFGYDAYRKTCSPLKQLRCEDCNFYKTKKSTFSRPEEIH